MPCISIDIVPQSFCHSFIAPSMIRYSKSAEKYAVQVCKVATVCHAAGSKLTNVFIAVNGELNKVSMYQK